MWLIYYENGNPESELTFENGNKVAETHYYETGKIDFAWKSFKENGITKLNVTDYYENGALKSRGTCINGETQGVWEYYYENGQLKSKGGYATKNFEPQSEEKTGFEMGAWPWRKEGLWREYHENGQLKRKVNFKDNVIVGTYIEYDKNGKKVEHTDEETFENYFGD